MIKTKYVFKGKSYSTYQEAELAEKAYFNKKYQDEKHSREIVDNVVQLISNQLNTKIYADNFHENGLNITLSNGEDLFKVTISAKTVKKSNENYADYIFSPDKDNEELIENMVSFNLLAHILH